MPARVYVPIVMVAAIIFLIVIGYFLRIGLGVTGAALGPQAQQGNAVPQTGGNGVGGGTPVPSNAGAIQRPARAISRPPPATRHSRSTT